MAAHNELGKQGEKAAANFLIKEGYKVVKQNWRMYRHEIDIVAEAIQKISLVELK